MVYEPRIVVVCGASGSGKTLWTRKAVARDRRVWVWDMKGEYARDGEYARVESLSGLLLAARSGARRVAYVARTVRDFEPWCRAAHAAAAVHGGLTCIVEELADVTTPGKAPDAWGIIVRRGRDRGMRVYAVTQRPSESDKTVMGNRTLLHVGRMPRAQDARYIEAEAGIPAAEIQHAPPLEWWEQSEAGAITKGRVKLKSQASRNVT